MFGPTSRYYAIPVSTLETSDGRTVAYVRRRFAPPPETLSLLHYYTVTEGERLDNIAAVQIGDPELFWRVCDANAAVDPHELTDTPGRRLRITLPEGIPGPRNG
jgi:hypothetical protein